MIKVSHSFIYKWSKTRLFSQHLAYCFMLQFYCHLYLHCFIQQTTFLLALHENETNRDVSSLGIALPGPAQRNQHCLLVLHITLFFNTPKYEVLFKFPFPLIKLISRGCLGKGEKWEVTSGSDSIFSNHQSLRSKLRDTISSKMHWSETTQFPML